MRGLVVGQVEDRIERALANSMGEISLSLRSIAEKDSQNGPTAGQDLTKNQTGSGVKLLKYGVKSRAYGVN